MFDITYVFFPLENLSNYYYSCFFLLKPFPLRCNKLWAWNSVLYRRVWFFRIFGIFSEVESIITFLYINDLWWKTNQIHIYIKTLALYFWISKSELQEIWSSQRRDTNGNHHFNFPIYIIYEKIVLIMFPFRCLFSFSQLCSGYFCCCNNEVDEK